MTVGKDRQFKNTKNKYMLYIKTKPTTTTISKNTAIIGETIEQKVRRVTTNKEPIKDGAPLIYTQRKDGVLPGTDIRTDRWDVAIDAHTKIDKTHKAKREERHKTKTGDEHTGKQAKEGQQREGDNQQS